jgi:hypothetical protein
MFSRKKYFSASALVLLSLTGFSQVLSGAEKEIGIGIAGFYFPQSEESYIMLSGSLNKKRHQFSGGIGYLSESPLNKTFDMSLGYKKYFPTFKILKLFLFAGLKGYLNKTDLQYLKCDMTMGTIDYKTGGAILFGGVGMQFSVTNKIVAGLSAQYGAGRGLRNNLEVETYFRASPNFSGHSGCYVINYFSQRAHEFYELLPLIYVEYRIN